jgi:hypothetical protein
MRHVAELGPRSLVIRVTMDAGSPVQEAATIVADDVEVIAEAAGGPIRAPYAPAKPENVQWWWSESGS